ncbi:MAG: MAPEG family protein [Ostreibacterium sp.]
MTVAYWCVFIVMFFPLICAMYAKIKSHGFTRESNHNVREFFAKSTGVTARANAAQLNSYEIFPVFAVAVVIVHLTGVAEQMTINIWAIIFVISRALFCYCYIADLARTRSIVWSIGFISVIALFIAAI